MKKIKAVLLFLLILFFLHQNISSAYDNKRTHKDLSRYAAEFSILRSCSSETNVQCDYLRQIGFRLGLKEQFTWNNMTDYAEEWMAGGGELEDNGSRSLNHFHNPLQPWPVAGLWGSNQSALLWAQSYNESQQPMSDDWSWQRTRKLYYLALTAWDENVRSMFIAETFRGLGQQMHLIQDMAVPAHVRNDAHPSDPLIGKNGHGRYFETWTKENVSAMRVFAPDPVMPLVVLSAPTDTKLTPIASLYDMDTYTWTAPISMADRSVGLSEWTSSNFFSDDTINMPGYGLSAEFPYPNAEGTDLEIVLAGTKIPETITAEDGIPDTGLWVSKTDPNIYSSFTVTHFVKFGYTTDEVKRLQGDSKILRRTFVLDDECHHDYAELLLPRAVGYSAALLNYFFRGNIEITVPDSGFYSAANPTGSGFTQIKLRAQNTTPNDETMPDGTVQLVVKYQPVQDTAFDYQVVTEASGTRTIPRGSPSELTFNLGTPVPFTATDVTIQVVYHGRLGNEDGAVAVGFKDISEPTPIDIYNAMDEICVNGTLYTCGSQSAIDAVDALGDKNGVANETDIYSHKITTLYVKISPARNRQWASADLYDFMVSNITPSSLVRAAYLLVEHEPVGVGDFYYSLYDIPGRTSAADTWQHVGETYRVDGTAFLNQMEYIEDSAQCTGTAACYKRVTSDPYSFRGNPMWWGGGFIYTNASYPADSQCPNDLL